MSTFKIHKENSFNKELGPEIQFNKEFLINETVLLIPFNLYIHTIQFIYYNNNNQFDVILKKNDIPFKTFPLTGAANQNNTDSNILSITNIDLIISLKKYDIIKFTSNASVDISCFFSERPNQTNIMQTHTIQTENNTGNTFSYLNSDMYITLDSIFD